VAVYGLDFVMAVRDYRELQQARSNSCRRFSLDMARAVKSEEELEGFRDSWTSSSMASTHSSGLTSQEIRSRNHGPAVERFLAPRRRPAQ